MRHCTTVRLLTAIAILAGPVRLFAADDASIAQPAALTTKASDQGWSNSGRIGLFFSNVATSNDSTSSLDPSINGAHGSEAWLAAYDDSLLWRGAHLSADQNLRLRYGRIDISGSPWTDNSDEVHYDGVLRRELSAHTFLYGADGVDSVFRNALDHRPLDPITAKASVGAGQQYHHLLLAGDPAQKDAGEDRFEYRVGVRAQKRWSHFDIPAQDRIETGPEGFVRYDRPVDKEVRWFIQSEIFTEFKDLHHISELITAGITAQLSRFVSADIAYVAYRERQPKEVPQGTPGYDQWAMREDALVGLTVTY